MSLMPLQRPPRAVLQATVIATVLLLGLAALVPVGGHWVVDCGSRWLEAEAIRTSGGQHWNVPWPGQTLSPDRSLLPSGSYRAFVHQNRVYVQYPPAFSALLALCASVIGPWGYRMPALLSGSFVAAMLALWGIRLKLRFPSAAAIVILVGTPLLPYSQTVWDMLPCIGLGLAALYLMSAESKWMAFSGGLIAGVAFALREEYLLWTTCSLCALATMRPWRNTALSGLGFLTVAIPLMTFNSATIGKPLYMLMWSTASDPIMSWTVATRGIVAYLYLARLGPLPPTTSQMLFDWTATAVAVLSAWFAVRGKDKAQILAGLSGLVLVGVYARLHSWSISKPFVAQFNTTSVIALLPLVFLGGFSLPAALTDERHNRMDQALLRRSALLFSAVAIALSPPVSAIGFHWGPRLLLPALPVLALLAWLTMEQLTERIPVTKSICAIGMATAFLDSAQSVDRLVLKTKLSRDLGATLLAESEPSVPIISERDWLALDVPVLWRDRMLIGAFNGRQAAAVDAARNAHPKAIWVTSDDLPEVVTSSSANIERIPLHPRVFFPDGLFYVAAYRITWKPK